MKKNIAIALFMVSIGAIQAQDTMYVHKKDGSTLSIATKDIDSILFYDKTRIIVDIDGNRYKTVKIGQQVWMAENLKTTRYSDGTTLPLVNTRDGWVALANTDKGYTWFGDDEANKTVYGALYTWGAATKGTTSDTDPSGVQGICPNGWHLPSEAEWDELQTFLGADPSFKLREAGIDHWSSPNTGATNQSGFTALPGGMHNSDGSFPYINNNGFWWTSGEDPDDRAPYRTLYGGSGSLDGRADSKKLGLSVRCIKD